MESISKKVAYVKEEAKKGTGNHKCHWPGCNRFVPPAMWGCSEHWYTLPKLLRLKIWNAYQTGQEISKRPSPEYVRIVREVHEWITKNHSTPKQREQRQKELDL